MSLARTVAWNTAIQVVGRVLGLLVSMVMTSVLTRHLGLGTYGEMVAAMAYVGLFVVLGDFGIYLLAVRRAAQESEQRDLVLGNALWLRLVLGLVPLVIATLLVFLLPGHRAAGTLPQVQAAVAILALNGYLTLLNQFLIAVFRLHLRMDLAVVGEMLARLVALCGVGIVVATGGGLVAAVVAATAGTGANLVFAFLTARGYEPLRPRFDPAVIGSMLRESGVLTMVTLLGYMHFRIDTLLLRALRSAADVGVYGVAYKLHEVLITFPGLFIALLFPVLSRLVHEDRERLRQVFQRTHDVLLVAGVGAGLLAFAVAPQLAPILGAADAVLPMRILALALPIVFVSLGFSHLVLAEARQKWLVPVYAVLVAANVGLNVVAIRAWSYLGAAAVTVVTEGILLALMLAYWIGRRRLRLRARGWLAVPLGLVVAAAAEWAERHLGGEPGLAVRVVRLAALALCSLGLYAGGILALGILPTSTLRELLRRGGAPEPPI